MKLILGLVSIVILIILLVSIKKNSGNAKFGINLKRVYCPKFNLKQPIIRKPKTENQILYGGYTCKNCNTEMDKYGTEIKSEI